jgi:hypothetical protein
MPYMRRGRFDLQLLSGWKEIKGGGGRFGLPLFFSIKEEASLNSFLVTAGESHTQEIRGSTMALYFIHHS